jgi:hypothetical protein
MIMISIRLRLDNFKKRFPIRLTLGTRIFLICFSRGTFFGSTRGFTGAIGILDELPAGWGCLLGGTFTEPEGTRRGFGVRSLFPSFLIVFLVYPHVLSARNTVYLVAAATRQ